MSTIDSSTGGYLMPADAPAPAEDADLDAIFQRAVTRITGLPGQLVRPRWQPRPPKQPEASVTWCAIGIIEQDPDAMPDIVHVSTGLGHDRLSRHEDLRLLVTFYGPAAQAMAGRLRDGLYVPQNREELSSHDIGFVAAGRIRAVPEPVNQQWIRRYDLLLQFRRKITRDYGVKHIAAADIHLIDDTHVDEVITVPPAP